MAVTVNINGLSCLHQTSGGIATATLPDVCRTPPTSSPIPYPNVAMSTDLVGGTVTVAVDGSSAAIQSSMFVRSTGDEAGALGGVVSQVFAMEATFLSFSPTVLMEGQPACRLTDKMLMNKGNTVCMLGAVNPIVLDRSMLPTNALINNPPVEPVFCHVDSFQLMCGHSDHPSIDGLDEGGAVLQVISTKDKPDVITVAATGRCGGGVSPTCPAVWVFQYPHGRWELVSLPNGQFKVPPPTQLDVSVKTVGQFLQRLIGDLPFTRDVYIFHPLICNSHPSTDVSVGTWAQVEVFHKAFVSGSVTLGYAHPTIKLAGPEGPGGTHSTPLIYNRLATWSIIGSIEANIGGRPFKLETSSDMEGSDPLPFFGELVDMIGTTTYVFDSMQKFGTNVKGEVLFPKWKFAAGSLELAELHKLPRVGLSGTFGVSFEPLIGFQLTVSLLDWLIIFAGSLAPGGGTVLAKGLLYIKEKLKPDTTSREWERKEAGASVDIDIELVAAGTLEGGMGMKFMEGNGELDGEKTNITGKITVQLEGRLIGKAKIWRVEFSGGGKVGLAAAEGDGKDPCEFKASVTATVEKGQLVPDGGVSFSGMAFYYLLFMEMGVGGLESVRTPSTDEVVPKRRTRTTAAPSEAAAAEKKPDEPEKKESKPKKLDKDEIKGSCVLIKPWSWSYRKGVS